MKRKTHFTRKNLIFLALLFFFLVMQTFVLLCMDAGSGIMKKNNPVVRLAGLFGFSAFELGVADYVTYFLIVFYTFVFCASILYEVRLAKYYGEDPLSKKSVFQYAVTLLLCLLLSFGLSILLQLPYTAEKYLFTVGMIWQTFLLGGLIYLVIASVIFCAFVLIVNFKNIDRPFRFFGKKETLEEEFKEALEIEEMKRRRDESDLSHSLDAEKEAVQSEIPSSFGTVVSPVEEEIRTKEQVFPGLCAIDAQYEFGALPIESDEIDLRTLSDRFYHYLAHHKMFFEKRTIREFIAGLSVARLIILEGLSGTGKSSLPRYFASFLGEDAFFAPVQATWRDRTSLLGYYNDFSRTFNETDFLKRLYRASYVPDEINLMVLDEMNLSRIEYYFADFLSVLEYPASDWKVHLMQLPYSFDAPKHIEEGKVRIPGNTFFIGTANKDDSTYTITDKVYDRAITIDFFERNEPFEPEGEDLPIRLSYRALNELFLSAQNREDLKMTEEDIRTFRRLADFTYSTFDITFGNRIVNQIDLFVPVFIACGGTKEEALDFMFSGKIMRKLEGRFEDYVRQGLEELKNLILSLYGNTFEKSLREIDRMLKRL